MHPPHRSVEDSGAESIVDFDGLAQEVSEEKNINNDLETILVIFW